MVKQIRSLDSDMQTLVYENYNKFISATGQLVTFTLTLLSKETYSKYICLITTEERETTLSLWVQ